MFRCFKRTFWKENPSWPNGLEPSAGKRRYFHDATFQDERDARQFCRDWNAANKPGRLSLKAEYEES